MNWLHVVDCIDFNKSEYDVVEKAEGRKRAEYDLWRIVINPAKVPSDVLVFRMKHSMVEVVIDAALAAKIKAAALSGPQFYRVDGSIKDEVKKAH